MADDRSFYKKTFTVTFYAEEPEILRESSLGSLISRADECEIMMLTRDDRTEAITTREAVQALNERGFDPDFFQIEAEDEALTMEPSKPDQSSPGPR